MKASGGTIVYYLRQVLGTYTPTGDSFGGADWEYIISGILFIIFCYCILRMIGSLFK